MSPQYADLPVIDFRSTKTDRANVARQVVDALSTHGFLILENIEGTDHEKLLEASEWLFNRPLEERMSIARHNWNPLNKNAYRGYTPSDATDSCNREMFEFGIKLPADDPEHLIGNVMYEDALWPEEDGTSNYKAFLTNYFDVMQDAALEMVRLIAIGLEQDEFLFDDLLIKKPLSTFRIVRYHPRTGEVPENSMSEDGQKLVCRAHTDTSIVTIIDTFHYDGLEIVDSEEKWLRVAGKLGRMAMNIGVMLAHLTGGRLKATKHRVADLGKHRYSVPFFMEPHYHIDVGKPPLKPDTCDMRENMARGVDIDEGIPRKYGPWLIKEVTDRKIREFEGAEKLIPLLPK